MRCVKGVGPNDVTLFISRRPQVRMRICLCRLFKVVKSSSGTGSVDTACIIIIMNITIKLKHQYDISWYYIYSGTPLERTPLVVDHAPPTIAASYDEALLRMTKKTILMRDLSTDSS